MSCWFWKKFQPDPDDKKRLEQAKEAQERLDKLHQELIDIHGQSKVISKNLKESREANHYGQAIMEAFKPKKKSDE